MEILKFVTILGNASIDQIEIISIRIPNNALAIQTLRRENKVRWSSQFNFWYILNTDDHFHAIVKTMRMFGYVDFCGFIRQNNLTPTTQIPPVDQAITKTTAEQITQFKRWLSSRRYSKNTIDTYIDAIFVFFRFYSGKDTQSITNEDIIIFNNDYILKKKLSSSYQNQIVNAIKLFFLTQEHKKLDLNLIHRPRRSFQLPNVLSKEEVKSILTALPNLKHKTMLSLIYSCGLRRSELLNLKPLDIDSNRGVVMIRNAKGNRDRMVPLSPKILILLREYYIAYKPVTWLFEGQKGNVPYDERSLASVMKQATRKAGIKKPVTLHWLRHSFATHHLEMGTDLRYIQELLGHKSSKTTEIYTHVSTRNIQNIKSPFDSLDM